MKRFAASALLAGCLLIPLCQEAAAQRRARPTPAPTASASPAAQTTDTGVILVILFWVGLTCVNIVLYFVPTMIARGKENFGAIFALNFFLGWTIIGWVGALVWALTKDRKTQ